MATDVYYRGGRALEPKPGEVKVDPGTGLLRTTYGISVSSTPEGLERFGGAFVIGGVPETLRIIQRGRRPEHFEVVPARPMSLEDYRAELAKITLTPL